MKYILIFNIFMFSACGKPYVEPELQVYVNRWNSIYSESASDTELRIVNDIGTNVVGNCNLKGNYIQIQRAYFNDCNNDTPAGEKDCDLRREQLVFHELGHCVLHLGHNTDHVLIEDELGVRRNIYKSIMYPSAFGGEPMYGDNLKYYHQELGQ